MQKKKIINLSGITLLLIAIIFFILSILFREYFQSLFEGKVENYGLFAFFFLVLLLEIIPQYVSPHFLMLNAKIIGIPLLSLTVVAVIAHTLSSVIGFYLGKRFGLKFVNSLYEKRKVIDISKKMEKHGKWIVLASAFLPLPYVPIIFGSLDLSWRTFTFYGIIPRGISFILLGILIFFIGI